jgi:hypothetical protein
MNTMLLPSNMELINYLLSTNIYIFNLIIIILILFNIGIIYCSFVHSYLSNNFLLNTFLYLISASSHSNDVFSKTLPFSNNAIPAHL